MACCPDSRMVYVPGDYPDKNRVTGSHFVICYPDEKQ
jgi:hypothetical protein